MYIYLVLARTLLENYATGWKFPIEYNHSLHPVGL